MPRGVWTAVTLLTLTTVAPAPAAEPTPAERGRKALTSTAFVPSFWPQSAYGLAWKRWGITEKPTDYDAAFRERYGLHPAPYPNDGLLMGLRLAPYLPLVRGIGIDCMTCHGGSIFAKSVVGLGNVSLDVQGLFEDLDAVGKIPAKLPFTFGNVRGTSEAGAFAVYLLGMRNDDLSPRLGPARDLGLRDDACEDVPAWWLLKKKRTMYHVGATDARSVRSIMQFMMHPLVFPADFHKAEPAFRDILEFLLALEPPKFPFPVDAKLAAKGKDVFTDHCAKCHGTYGADWTYPNRVIPLAEIGTDPTRYRNIGVKFGEAYNASWFAKEKTNGWFLDGKPLRMTPGYQAPPLDGVWATAPYFHNGSVPTLYAVLNSKARPKVFTRSYRTLEEDYDKGNVGWKVTEVSPPDAKVSGYERRKVYDTSKPGRGNGGHTYGDDLTEAERRAVIEYLKTL
jgi:mono/diheme cytochrome c family protein